MEIITGSSSSESARSIAPFLAALNPAQLRAVQHDPKTPLQILAGPGSGKTKVLTSRIAYLILMCSIPPSSICAVTFTNKAANEMRERLVKLIGEKLTSEVRMGTFHALCAVFLRRHGKMVGLGTNFTICDFDESKKIISTLITVHKSFLDENHITLKEGTVLSMISKAKAKGHTAADFLTQLREPGTKAKELESITLAPTKAISYFVAEVYKQYERILQRSNSLDFDDMLLYGVKLFTDNVNTTSWCKYVLVDEFQDTNTIQYKLMKALVPDNCVTVVGDPDQSIYGWRSANIGNLAKMREDFCGVEQILLEQNYRSTGAILRASLALVAQDRSRIQKSLHTTHPAGMTPVLRLFPTEYEEATFIAIEIKRLVAQMGGVLHWGDFAVLLRFNALSRAIESALQKEGIPNRVLGGHKFFERLEVRNLLAYLQLIDNPSFNPALERAVNVPNRGIGEKTLLEIASRAEKLKVSQLDVIEGICDGRLPDIKPAAKRKLISFVKTVRGLRDLANNGTSPANLIRRLLDLVGFQSYLRKTRPDWESRWENVQELITFASEVEASSANVNENGQDGPNADTSEETPLRLFLQTSMLSSEGDNQNEKDSKEKVTISTCHAAKGLEWPVVMIPAVEQEIFPFYRADDAGEERRLLYVACTRAQGLLYLSHVEKRKVAGDTQKKEVSEFISVVVKEDPTLFASLRQGFQPGDRMAMSSVLNRPPPDEIEVSHRMAEFDRVMRSRVDNASLESRLAERSKIAMLPKVQADTHTDFIPSNNILPMATSDMTTISSKQHHKPLATSLMNGASRNENIPPPESQTFLAVTPQTIQPTYNTDLVGVVNQGTKRRLGMGRGTVGYVNKRFKPPT